MFTSLSSSFVFQEGLHEATEVVHQKQDFQVRNVKMMTWSENNNKKKILINLNLYRKIKINLFQSLDYTLLFSLGSTTPRSVYGGGTPRGGGHTPGQNTPSYRQSSSGNAWAAAAESWASGRRTPSGKGYSTTPRYDQDPRLTPKYGGGGGRTPQQAGGGSRSMPPPQGGRPPAGRTPTHGGRTPTHGGGGRTPQYSSSRSESGRTPGTPRGQFGDSTPLYDE